MKNNGITPDRVIWENKYKENEDSYISALKDISRKIEAELTSRHIAATIKYRLKSFESYYKKMLRRLKEKDHRENSKVIITDLLGIRIVCPFLETISVVEGIIRELFDVTEIEKKGIKHSYREFGYDSTHLMIVIPQPVASPEGETLDCVEIQVRTILQEAWAEVEHELVYKAGFNPFDTPLKRKLAALNANLTLSDIIFQEIRDYQRQLQKELGNRRDNFSRILLKRTLAPDLEEQEKVHTEDNDCSEEKNANSLSEPSMDELLLRGLLAHNKGKYKLAIKIYNQLLTNEDLKVQGLVYVHRGMALFAESRYREALKDFSKALKLNPKNSRTFYLRGITCRMLSDYRHALEDFNMAVKLDPGQFDFWFARAQLYYHSGDYPASIKDCKAALKLDPESKELEQFFLLLKKKSRLF